MIEKKYTFRFVFLLLVVIIFMFPIIQYKFHIFPDVSLTGVTESAVKPTFTLQSFWSGQAQQQTENWLDQHNSIKNIVVKTNNQLYYSLFSQASPNSTIVEGKSNQLFESVYIHEFNHQTPLLDQSILENKVQKMKIVQDEVTRLGKTFVFLITPSKAAVYPEFLPSRSSSSEPRNYDLLLPLLEKYHINYIDGHRISMENKRDTPIFPKGGIHWNLAGAFFTLQKLTEQINELSPSLSLPELNLKSIDYVVPTGFDRDLADLLNLWKPPVNYTVPQPIIDIDKEDSPSRPSIAIESGSFSFQLIQLLNENNFFSTLDLYYYYSTHRQYTNGIPDFKDLGIPKHIDWNKEVLNHDIIIKEVNEALIGDLSRYDFIDDAASLISPQNIEFQTNTQYVDQIDIGGTQGYRINKGADGSATVYLTSTTPLHLEPNQSYTLSYTAKGFHTLRMDLYPDDLPQFNNGGLTDQFNDFSFEFSSDSENIKNATLRFFIDGINAKIPQDSYLYNIKLTKNS
ncbi:alginate O-acetyltransferase AlgX-related protein [Paenibacillus sp. YIM B09110]|uniref:alginate O-acetyltransferase AlgX-related protein n=1 Tax=Paenibacillus sp. YIM B09110 TaxID=3126102 RepID=UPI00301C99C0